jgi:hypothetical protein
MTANKIRLLIDLRHTDVPSPLDKPGIDVVDFPFSTFPDEAGDDCLRCNRLICEHVWQLVDPDETEQQGVIDCEVAA